MGPDATTDTPMALPDESTIAATMDRADGGAPEPIEHAPEAHQEPPAAEQAPAERPRDEAGRFAKLEDDLDRIEADPAATPQSLAEVKRMRQELKGYRERYSPYEQAFGKMDPGDAQAVLGFVELLQQDPAAAAQWMRTNADRLSPAQEKAMEAAAQQAGAPEAAPSAAEEEFDPYDPAQIDKRIEERAKALLDERLKADREQEEQQRFVAQIQQTAKDLGYSPGTSDYEHLLVEAKYHEGDLRKAHAALESRRGQGTAPAAEATDGEAGAPRRVTAPEGVAPSGRKEPATLDDAQASAMKRLEGMGFR